MPYCNGDAVVLNSFGEQRSNDQSGDVVILNSSNMHGPYPTKLQQMDDHNSYNPEYLQRD
jgi:hypothetical protein